MGAHLLNNEVLIISSSGLFIKSIGEDNRWKQLSGKPPRRLAFYVRVVVDYHVNRSDVQAQ
ncbi:MAG: hypothetical protein ACTS6H_01920 [Candidatus Hodgkinia cicadicola]